MVSTPFGVGGTGYRVPLKKLASRAGRKQLVEITASDVSDGSRRINQDQGTTTDSEPVGCQ